MINFVRRFTATLLLLIFSVMQMECYAQNSRMDSLLLAFKVSKPDTQRVNILNELSKEAVTKGSDYDTAVFYARQAKTLGEKLGFKKGVAVACINLGNANVSLGNYNEAYTNYSSGLQIAEEMGNKSLIGKSHSGLGNFYWQQGNYPEAIVSYLATLRIAEELNDQSLIGKQYNNLGLTYQMQGNYDEALKCHEASLEIKTKLGDKQGMAKSYNNIGLIHLEKRNYDSALKYYNESLKLKEELKDRNGIAMSYNNIGTVQFAQGKYAEALENFTLALDIREQLGDKRGVSASYGNIGMVYLALGEPQKAKMWTSKSLEMSLQIGNKEIISNDYHVLSQADSALGDFKSSFAHYKLYVLYRDSLSNEENTKKTLQAQMQFDFDKKEAVFVEQQDKERAIAEEKSRKQKLITYFVAGGLILVLIFALFILRSLSVTRKQKRIIENQEAETRTQKHIIEEKHREITDSINYAERIQRSFLATKDMLDDNLSDYFVFFRPKDVVSGDFYWASKLVNGNFAFACADSTGHGVPGAIMSILNISSLELAVKEGVSEPAEILNYTRRAIISRLENDGSAEGGKDGMDCSLVVFNHERTKLIYSAANNPVWIVRGDQLIELKPDKMPVGKHLNDHLPFIQHEMEIQKGDLIYSLTDGMPDQFGGPKGKKYKYGQLKELLISIASLPMPEQQDRLSNEFEAWKGDLEQIDDVTLLGIRV